MRVLTSLAVLSFLAVLFTPALASAQTRLSPEVFGRIGIVNLWSDESNLGAGVSVAAGAGVRLSGTIGLEGLVEHHTNKRHFDSGVLFDSKVVGFSGRLVKYFGATAVRPYVGGSAGLARVNTVSTYPGLPTNERTMTSRAFGGFSGLGIQAGPRVSLRPEVGVSKAAEHLRIGGTVAAGIAW